MPVKQDFALDLDPQAYMAQRGARFARLAERPDWQAAFRAALEDMRALAEPRACWDAFPVERVEGSRVWLANGALLDGGVLGQFVEGADRLFVLVCTLGPAVEARVEACQRSGEALRGLMLDELANWALSLTRQEVLAAIREDEAARGRHHGVPISPGQSGWPIHDQRVIFSLLDAAPIGVTLSRSCLMLPVKSVSTVLGTGPQPVGPAVVGKVPCDFCPLSEHCPYSRAGQGAPGGV